MALIAARGLGKSFGSRSILHGLDLDIEPGARLGMIGPNGGGKSTLLRILAGEETADAGDVTQRRGLVVAFLPQQPEGDSRDAAATLRDARPDLAELEDELAPSRAPSSANAGDDLDRMSAPAPHGRRTCSHAGPQRADRDSTAVPARSFTVSVWTTTISSKPTRVLSGGQRKLVGLAACLCATRTSSCSTSPKRT